MISIDPRYLFVIIGNVLVFALNIALVRGARRRAAEMARPLSNGNPTSDTRTMLFKDGDAYGGAFIAVVFIIIATALYAFRGLGGDWQSFDWSDPGTLFMSALRVMLLVLPALLTTLAFPNEFFLLSREGIEQERRGKRTHLAWNDVISISQYSKDRVRGITLKGKGAEVMVPENIDGAAEFYRTAVQRLPDALHQDPTYLWMASMAVGYDSEKGR